MKTPIDGSAGWAPPRDLTAGRERGLAAVRSDRMVFWGLLVLIAWAPLPLASNRPLAWSFLSLLAGGLAVVWAVGALARPDTVKPGWRRRRDVVMPAFGLAATALLAIHGLADFSTQMPAVAVIWTALPGVAYAQSWPCGDWTA